MKHSLFFIFTFLLLSCASHGQATATDYMRAAIEATNKKQYTRAIELCNTAISMNSTESTAYFHRGYNKVLLKDYDAAIVDLTVCLDLSPDNLSAFLYRGYSNQKAGNSMAATRDYNSARKLDIIETLAFLAAHLF